MFLLSDEYKCSLPDVTSIDDNLDITRFRSDFSKISEVSLNFNYVSFHNFCVFKST